MCHNALRQRVRAIGAYHRSHAARRCAAICGPIRATRSSLPGAAVVAVANMCAASRWCAAEPSSVARSTPGRQVEVSTVGAANTTSSSSSGETDLRSATVTASRSSQPAVEKTDMYMWSSTKIWLRSTDSRSSRSGRSWWAMVVTPACSRATCDLSAIDTLSRNRRCTRVLTVFSSQVAVADRPRPRPATTRRLRSWCCTPELRSCSHSAISASGSAASTVRPKATPSSRGSCW